MIKTEKPRNSKCYTSQTYTETEAKQSALSLITIKKKKLNPSNVDVTVAAVLLPSGPSNKNL